MMKEEKEKSSQQNVIAGIRYLPYLN